jgi:putative N6-adenine-specific DNA methylase
MMANVGDRLKQAFAGWQAWFLTSDRSLPRQLRLRETRRTVLFNGPIECRFFRFELVGGGYRPRGSSADQPISTG